MAWPRPSCSTGPKLDESMIRISVPAMAAPGAAASTPDVTTRRRTKRRASMDRGLRRRPPVTQVDSGTGVTLPLTIADFERHAAAVLEPGPLAYYAGGSGDEVTLRDNVAAWQRLAIRPRVLVDVERAPSPAVRVLGRDPAPADRGADRLPPPGPRRRARSRPPGAAAAQRRGDLPLVAGHDRRRRARRRRARRHALVPALRLPRSGACARALVADGRRARLRGPGGDGRPPVLGVRERERALRLRHAGAARPALARPGRAPRRRPPRGTSPT